jgi:hypothetical protein
MAENEAKAGTPSGTPPTEEQERVNRRRVREGTVVENRMDKTAVVAPRPCSGPGIFTCTTRTTRPRPVTVSAWPRHARSPN